MKNRLIKLINIWVIFIGLFLFYSNILQAQSVQVYTLNDAGSRFYDRVSDTSNPAPDPTDISWEQLDVNAMLDTVANDSNWYETKRTTARDQFDSQLYRLRIAQTPAKITQIDPTWVGYGENQASYSCYLYIWNNNSTLWELIQSSDIGTPDGTLTGTLTTGLTDYVDSNGFLWLLAQAKHYNYAPNVPVHVSPADGSQTGWPVNATLTWTVTDDDGDTPIESYASIRRSDDGWTNNSGWITLTSWNTGAMTRSWWYYWKVQARDDLLATSAFSAEWSIWGSCPLFFVYEPEQDKYKFVSDMEAGGIGKQRKRSDLTMDNYLVLGEDITPDKENNYRVKIREVMNEITYLDKAKLLLVDHPADIEIYTSSGERTHPSQNYRPKEFHIFMIKDAILPKTAINKTGKDMLDVFSKSDDNCQDIKVDDNYEFTFDFGKIKNPKFAKLVIDGWRYVDEGYGNKFPDKIDKLPKIMMLKNSTEGDSKEIWEEVRLFGHINGMKKTMVIEIGKYLKGRKNHKIKIVFPQNVKRYTLIDRIRLDCYKPDYSKINVTVVDAKSAYLSYAGETPLNNYNSFLAPVSCEDESITVMPARLSLGSFTKYGDVRELLEENDNQYVIMNSGDQVELKFKNSVPVPAGMKRTLILNEFQWYKARPKNGYRTVTPLPFHGMQSYPKTPNWLQYPMTKENAIYLKKYNVREYDQTLISKYYNAYDKNLDKSINSINIIPHSLNTNYLECSITYTSGSTQPPSDPTASYPDDAYTDAPVDILFRWSASSGATPITYNLQVSTDQTFSSVDFDYPGLTVTYKQVTGLTLGAAYYWRVNATNAYGTSLWTTTRSLTVGSIPSIPTLNSPADAATGESKTPLLQWGASTGGGYISYSVEVDDDPGFGSVDFSSTSIYDTQTLTSVLTEGVLYYWHVKATSSFGSSSWSTSRSFTVGALPSIPVLTAPLDLSAGNYIPVLLDWGASTGTGSITYSVMVGEDIGFSTVVVNQGNLTDTQFYIPSLSIGMTYYWKIQATNEVGDSGWSTIWSFTTDTDIVSPSVPVITYPANTATDVPLTLTFIWESSTGTSPITYTMQLSDQSDFSSVIVEPSFLTENWYTYSSSLSYGTTYYWRVKGVNEGGESAYSSTSSFTTIYDPSATPPSVPALSSPSDGASQIHYNEQLVWTPSSGPGTIIYYLQIDNDSDFSSPVIDDSTGISDVFYKITKNTLYDNTNYYWRVKALNEYGDLGWSSSYSFTYETTDDAPPGQETPTITVNDDTLGFVFEEGDIISSSQMIYLWNAGSGVLQWSLSVDQNWVTVSPDSGNIYSEYDELTVTVNPTGFTEGTKTAYLTITDEDAVNSPFIVEVDIEISKDNAVVASLPDAPGILTNYKDVSIDFGADVGVSWNSVTSDLDITYEVQIASDSGFQNIVDSKKDLTTTSYAVSAVLLQNNTYYWRVRAKDNRGYSVWSETAKFKMLPKADDVAKGCFIKYLFSK